ncbi:MAG: pyridoxamine 5'-phosphate oxidase family protein [bacterium]
MSFAMTREEREAFLAGPHVAVLGISEDGRGPLTLPVWYHYEPGGAIRISTSGRSKKAELIRKAGRISLLVQTETPPYAYVSVEGPARIDQDADITELERSLAIRYLGEKRGTAYFDSTADQRAESVLVILTPERWLTVDYAKEHPAAE